MTWKECQLITLQKMFAAKGTDIVIDQNTREYLAAMPYAANEAMATLCTAGKQLIGSIVIAHVPPRNLATVCSFAGVGDFEIEGGSYTYDLMGSVTIDGEEVDAADFVTRTGHGKTLITSESPYVLKDIGVYGEVLEDVPHGGAWIRYDLAALAPDFYRLKPDDLVLDGKRYTRESFYVWEGESILVLSRDKTGIYTVYYYKYPALFDGDTPEETEMPLSQEENVLIPLYMASQLYKDDDLAIATTYRNEFEVALERIKRVTGYGEHEQFGDDW